MSQSCALEVRDLRKTYKTVGGKQQALNGLDLTVPRGHIYGYVGPNGAGKSTSIKILLGLVQADSGSARVMGHPAGSVEARRLLGFLPEVAVYHEFMGAEELLLLHAALAGVPSHERARRCQSALEMVGLAERRKSRIREFSKGMKQRFGIAQAVVADPPLLILDELTSGLDPIAQRELKDLILGLKARGITIFFSSHVMSEVETICDSIGIIHQGKLRAEGTLQDLLRLENQVSIQFRGPNELLEKLSDLKACRTPTGDLLVTVPNEETDRALSEVLGAGGSIATVLPAQRHLEDVLHQLVRRVEATP